MNAGSMAAATAAVESGDMGVLAMKHKDYQQALFYLNLGIQQAPLTMPMIAAKLLKHRADCFWEMEKKRDACQDMRNAIDLNVHTQIPGCEREVGKLYRYLYRHRHHPSALVETPCTTSHHTSLCQP